VRKIAETVEEWKKKSGRSGALREDKKREERGGDYKWSVGCKAAARWGGNANIKND